MNEQNKIQSYLSNGLQFKIGLYFKLAKRNLSSYRFLSIVALLSGSIVPVFINSNFLPVKLYALATTVLCLIVIASIGLESVYNFRQQYRNNKNSEHLLRKEKSLYEAKAWTYSNNNEINDKLFVKKVEALILKERGYCY